MANRNNDGFDFDGCTDVFVSNCKITSIDDSICLKSTKNQCSRFVVSNCIISSETAAIKLGTSSRAGFKDISIANCVFHDCLLGAIKLLMVEVGVMENITISNITMKNVEGPLFIRLGNRGLKFERPCYMNYGEPRKNEGVALPGKLRNVMISNIQCDVIANGKDKAGIMITGIPGSKIENVALSNTLVVIFSLVNVDNSLFKVNLPHF